MVNAIANGNCLQQLHYLLEFLAAWEERPICLTFMAYQWCSTISEAAGALGQKEMSTNPSSAQVYYLRVLSQQQQQLRQFRLRLQQQDPVLDPLSSAVEEEFSNASLGYDSARLNDTYQTYSHLEDLTPDYYAGLLPITLEIGFRLAVPGNKQPALHLGYTSHYNWVFETAFSSHDDGIIADAVCAWISGGNPTSPGSCVGYFTKRVERNKPFSPRLQWASVRLIEHIWPSKSNVSESEIVHLLNCLNVDLDDMEKEDGWLWLLVDVICSPAGLESLSPHYWHLLDKLVLARPHTDFTSRYMDPISCSMVTRSLEEAEDWEKLEVWMLIVWQSAQWFESMEGVEQVTLKLLSQQPLALPRFEGICEMGILWAGQKVKLQQICNQVQMEQLTMETLPLYVSIYPSQHTLS